MLTNVFFKIFLSLIFFSFSLSAMEGQYSYIQVAGGLDWVEDKIPHTDFDHDLGYAARIAGGLKWGSGFRTELELGYRYNDIGDVSVKGTSAKLKGHLSYITVFGNILYDFDSCWDITPYLGAGVGYQQENAGLKGHNLKHTKLKKNSVTGQFIVGLSYPLCECVLMSLDYRIFPFDEDSRSHVLAAGLSYLY